MFEITTEKNARQKVEEARIALKEAIRALEEADDETSRNVRL